MLQYGYYKYNNNNNNNNNTRFNTATGPNFRGGGRTRHVVTHQYESD